MAEATLTRSASRWPVWLYPANLLTELRLLLLPFLLWDLLHGRYREALIIFILAGISDGLDGTFARVLQQRSTLGQLLDPIADKLLLSSLFVVLAIDGRLPWLLTILVFIRDGCILVTALTLYFATGFRDFRPSWLGKSNTVAELIAVGLVMLGNEVGAAMRPWERASQVVVFALTYSSGIHYAFAGAERFHGWKSAKAASARGPASPASRSVSAGDPVPRHNS